MTRPPHSAGSRSSYWDGVAGTWSARPIRGLWREHSDATNIELLRRWWPGRVSRVLKTDLFDEAVGSGLVPFLAERTATVHALDISAEMARLARRMTGRVMATAADVRSLPFGDGTFDLVVSNSTLDHFERDADINRSLRELHRVLVPGGRLIVTFDNPANPVVAIRNALPFHLTRRLGLTPYFVGATCDREEGSRMLAEAGFVGVNTTTIMHCPRILAMMAASLCDRFSSGRLDRTFLRAARAFEVLERWPTAYRTGYFVAFLVEKPLCPR